MDEKAIPLSPLESEQLKLFRSQRALLETEKRLLIERAKNIQDALFRIDREEDGWLAAFGTRNGIPLEQLKNIRIDQACSTISILSENKK
jgi:hypothetical protein